MSIESALCYAIFLAIRTETSLVITGDRIKDSQPGFDSPERGGGAVVSMALDDTGGRIMRQTTRENVKKRMAMMLVEKNQTVVLTWPLAPRAHEATLPVSPDTQLFIWTLAWDTHAVIHQPFAIFDSNIYYPERRTLAYSENLLGSTIFAAPVLWASGNPLLAMNIVALLSVVLSGLGAYLLAVRLGMRRDAAVLAGAVFAFAPARLFRISQLHLTTIQWVPFTLAFLHTYLDSRKPRDLRLAIAFFTLQVLTSGHGAVFVVVAAAALIVCRLFFVSLSSASRILPAEAGSHASQGAPSPESRAPSSFVRLVKDIGLTGILLVVPAALIAIPYHRVQVEMGLKRPLRALSGQVGRSSMPESRASMTR